jgi:hypothetical protein
MRGSIVALEAYGGTVSSIAPEVFLIRMGLYRILA